MVAGRPLLHTLASLGPLERIVRRATLLVVHGAQVRVSGAARVPKHGPLLIAAGHRSGSDLAILGAALPRRFGIVTAARFDGVPVLGALLRWRGAYPLLNVGFGADEENARALARIAADLRAGAAVAIFPQGYRGTVGTGPARIAAASAAPVLPVSILLFPFPRARWRVLVRVHRPVAPPADDPRERRRFRDRWKRRMRATAGLTGQADRELLLAIRLDDRRLWRDPRRVVRTASRLSRLPEATTRAWLPAARCVRRACAVLRCAPDDLRHPPGAGTVAAWLGLHALALPGMVLNVPLALLSRAGLRAAGLDAPQRRATRLHLGPALLVPWGALLVAAGWPVLGARAVVLPLLAAVGALAFGRLRSVHRRVVALGGVRRAGQRTRRRLHVLDRSIDAAVAPSAPRGESVPVRVEFYAGGRADEEPRVVHLEAGSVEVRAVLDRARSPQGRSFTVRLEDGRRCHLVRNDAQDAWFLRFP